MKRFAVRAGVSMFALGVLAVVSGCPARGFQIFLVNGGDFPVVGVYITPVDDDEWGDNRLDSIVPAGQSVLLSWEFAKGAVYDVAVVYDLAPNTADGNLVPLYTKIDTSALSGDYVTLSATYKQDGSHGSSYTYGLPD